MNSQSEKKSNILLQEPDSMAQLFQTQKKIKKGTSASGVRSGSSADRKGNFVVARNLHKKSEDGDH